jgi:hypothetical protein
MLMRTSARTLVAVAVLLLLGGLAALGWWYQARQQPTAGQPAGTLTVEVTSAADRGPGTLREALFIVAAATGKADVLLKVKSIAPETPLPPLVNPHGVRILTQQGGTEIDARGLSGGPLLDVAGANTSIEGLQLRNCAAGAILLRAAQFRLRTSTIESCDVGVDVAENASDVLLEQPLHGRSHRRALRSFDAQRGRSRQHVLAQPRRGRVGRARRARRAWHRHHGARQSLRR